MKWAKRIFALVALGVVLYLFWPLLDELQAAVVLFQQAEWSWLPLILAIQLLSYASLTWLNMLALQSFSGRISFGRLTAVLSAMAFIETAIPSAGASGVALRARLLGKHGNYPLEASMFSLGVETIYEIVAIASVGLFGLVYLIRTGDLTLVQAVGLSAVGAVAVLLVWAGWRFVWDHDRSHAFLVKVGNAWNRLVERLCSEYPRFPLRLRPVDLTNMEQRLELFQAGLEQMRGVPRWKFWLAAYGRVGLDVATLGWCFMLFQHIIPISTLLTGYGLILLLSGMASLPGGLGLADASVPVIFASLGAPGPVALAAGLTYRMIGFWSLRFIGFLCWQVLESGK